MEAKRLGQEMKSLYETIEKLEVHNKAVDDECHQAEEKILSLEQSLTTRSSDKTLEEEVKELEVSLNDLGSVKCQLENAKAKAEKDIKIERQLEEKLALHADVEVEKMFADETKEKLEAELNEVNKDADQILEQQQILSTLQGQLEQMMVEKAEIHQQEQMVKTRLEQLTNKDKAIDPELVKLESTLERLNSAVKETEQKLTEQYEALEASKNDYAQHLAVADKKAEMEAKLKMLESDLGKLDTQFEDKMKKSKEEEMLKISKLNVEIVAKEKELAEIQKETKNANDAIKKFKDEKSKKAKMETANSVKSNKAVVASKESKTSAAVAATKLTKSPPAAKTPSKKRVSFAAKLDRAGSTKPLKVSAKPAPKSAMMKNLPKKTTQPGRVARRRLTNPQNKQKPSYKTNGSFGFSSDSDNSSPTKGSFTSSRSRSITLGSRFMDEDSD